MAIKGEKVDANEVLTFEGQPADGETVRVWDVLYTFKKPVKIETDLLADVPYTVAVGATLAETIENLSAAVSGGDGAGTRYARSTGAHPRYGRRKAVATHTTLIFGPEAEHAESDQKKKEAVVEKEAKATAKEAKAEAKAKAKVKAGVDADDDDVSPPIEPEPKPDPNRS